ncbi:MAG: retroviral-like aspartic protease [Chloroflexota bacterium]|nr:retroviral-like aspartic protease [Chloroflexota bacterium]
MRFVYTKATADLTYATPRLPMVLSYRDQSIQATGLLDSGATVNVLPYYIGAALGIVWEEQPDYVELTGNLAQLQAKAIILTAFNPQIMLGGPIYLGFAWTQSENTPMILGHINFFETFNVCFYGQQNVFDIQPITQQELR